MANHWKFTEIQVSEIRWCNVYKHWKRGPYRQNKNKMDTITAENIVKMNVLTVNGENNVNRFIF